MVDLDACEPEFRGYVKIRRTVLNITLSSDPLYVASRLEMKRSVED